MLEASPRGPLDSAMSCTEHKSLPEVSSPEEGPIAELGADLGDVPQLDGEVNPQETSWLPHFLRKDPNQSTLPRLASQRVRFLRLLWCNGAGMRATRVLPLPALLADRERQLLHLVEQGPALTKACMCLPCWGDEPAPGSGFGVVGDVRLLVDLGSIRLLPWHPSHAIAQVNMLDPYTGGIWSVDPRGLLQRITRLAAEQGESRRLPGSKLAERQSSGASQNLPALRLVRKRTSAEALPLSSSSLLFSPGLSFRAGFELEFVLATKDGKPVDRRAYCSSR